MPYDSENIQAHLYVLYTACSVGWLGAIAEREGPGYKARCNFVLINGDCN